MKIRGKAAGKAGPLLVGLLAGASLAGFALPALGDNGSPHRSVSAASRLQMTPAKGFISKSSGLKVRYFGSQGTVQASAEDGFALKCPKKTPHAISSFFGPATKEGLGQVVLSDSLPDAKTGRTWDIGVKNLGPTPLPYVAGVVCIQ
jgi:hypothetical protein